MLNLGPYFIKESLSRSHQHAAYDYVQITLPIHRFTYFRFDTKKTLRWSIPTINGDHQVLFRYIFMEST